MHQGSCHCGAVRLTLPSTPTVATECNCSLCRRIGGIWAYFEFGTVTVTGHPQATDEYIWGDRTLRNVRCRNCGNVTCSKASATERATIPRSARDARSVASVASCGNP